MPNLTLSVRIAASSILLLSVLHVLFWAVLAIAAYTASPAIYPINLLFPIASVFSVAGLFGVFTGVGVFRVRSWARITALVIAAIVLLFCALGILVVGLTLVGVLGLGLGIEVPTTSKTYFLGMGLAYLSIFLLAIWWIYVFSRRSTAAQFTSTMSTDPQAISKKPSCPPPITLLAWLMIVSAGLSALSWPLVLGRIPVMLFTQVFSMASSKWIWAANVVLFLICGIGLLKLQRWSYTGAIGLHVFWLVSMFISQMSPLYEPYLRLCLNALEIPETYPGLSVPRFSPWLTAVVSAVPTALLIAGLFYYRRNFLKAVEESHQQTP